MTEPTDLIIVVQELPAGVHPAFLHRHDGVAVVFAHTWADRYDLLRWMHANLDDYELDDLREAFGWPTGMVPTGWLEESGPMAVPESFWPAARSQ